MATNRMKCEKCKYEGIPSEFEKACPMCGDKDQQFPLRRYRCGSCQTEGSQEEFFPGGCADVDPIFSDGEPLKCQFCKSGILEQVV